MSVYVLFTLKKLLILIFKSTIWLIFQIFILLLPVGKLHSNNPCMNEYKKKIAFIINPISGTQSKEQILKWLDEKLDKERYEQEVIYTERAGHAVEIAAQKAQENAHAVIAIGGEDRKSVV